MIVLALIFVFVVLILAYVIVFGGFAIAIALHFWLKAWTDRMEKSMPQPRLWSHLSDLERLGVQSAGDAEIADRIQAEREGSARPTTFWRT